MRLTKYDWTKLLESLEEQIQLFVSPFVNGHYKLKSTHLCKLLHCGLVYFFGWNFRSIFQLLIRALVEDQRYQLKHHLNTFSVLLVSLQVDETYAEKIVLLKQFIPVLTYAQTLRKQLESNNC